VWLFQTPPGFGHRRGSSVPPYRSFSFLPGSLLYLYPLRSLSVLRLSRRSRRLSLPLSPLSSWYSTVITASFSCPFPTLLQSVFLYFFVSDLLPIRFRLVDNRPASLSAQDLLPPRYPPIRGLLTSRRTLPTFVSLAVPLPYFSYHCGFDYVPSFLPSSEIETF